MVWSLFGKKNKFEKRNPQGYKLFDELFSDFFMISFGKSTDEWLAQGWTSYELDFSKTKQAIKGGLDPKNVGFGISIQVNNHLFSQRDKIDRSQDEEYYKVIGNALAIADLARMIFGWSPAISESTGSSAQFILKIMIDTSIGLISKDDAHEDKNIKNLIVALNSGYEEMMKLARNHCKLTS